MAANSRLASGVMASSLVCCPSLEVNSIFKSDSTGRLVKSHNSWKREIRVGSLKDSMVIALIPDPVEKAVSSSAAEGGVVDAAPDIYGAE
jgi:hypothetical protein